MATKPSEKERVCFIAEYFDPQSCETRKFQLIRYGDMTLEMSEMKNRRKFLKRTPYPALQERDLYVGATVNIFSRSFRLVDYGDDSTRQHFATNAAQFVLIVHGNGLRQAGSIVEAITSRELRISNARMVHLPHDAAAKCGVPSSLAFVVVLNGSNAAEKVEGICGAFPGCVIALTDGETAKAISEIAYMPENTAAAFRNSSICVVKPHAVTSGYQGPILQRLLDEGFEVSAVGMFSLSAADAEDFLEVYNGVVPEYRRLVEEFASGPCWAIEVRAENAVNALRAVCGPHDPEVCHVLFPHTLRSKFGIDRTRNAVHCTDLLEDAQLESEFFFSLMLKAQ